VKKLILSIFFYSLLFNSVSAKDMDTVPTYIKGAATFKQRCTLCHGNMGMGEGSLALNIKDYPKTNLLLSKKISDDTILRNTINWGSDSGYSPPWGNELTWTQMESVILFVKYLRKNTEKAIKLLEKQEVGNIPSLKIGASRYNALCKKCHGKTGKGDGKMAKIIKDPPITDFTEQNLSTRAMRNVILQGGEAMSLSPKMPPWGDELSSTELESLIMYIKTLR